jgi:hypothetical protein
MILGTVTGTIERLSVGGNIRATGNITAETNLTSTGTSTLTGRVGIGTTPHSTYVCDVNGTLNTTNVLVNGNPVSGSKWTGTTNIYYNGGSVGIGASTTPTSLLELTKVGTVGTNDLLNMKYDANWGLKIQQNYTGTGNIQYNLIHKYNTVDYNALTFKGANIVTYC